MSTKFAPRYTLPYPCLSMKNIFSFHSRGFRPIAFLFHLVGMHFASNKNRSCSKKICGQEKNMDTAYKLILFLFVIFLLISNGRTNKSASEESYIAANTMSKESGYTYTVPE